MSYAPGFDGPPVSTLPTLPFNGTVPCCGAEGFWIKDRYYARRWPDTAPDCYVWTCPCGRQWKGQDL